MAKLKTKKKKSSRTANKSSEKYSAFPRWIGVVHLPSLPGSPGAFGVSPEDSVQRAGQRAYDEVRQMTQAGIEGIILENFGDIPFYGSAVPPETIASLALIAGAIREICPVPLGINVLRNDARAALAIASVAGLDFIRVNVLAGVVATDQGWIEGQAAELLREKGRLQSEVRIFADVQVKHAVTVHSHSISGMVRDVCLRSMADAVIVSGDGTGLGVDPEVLGEASVAAAEIGVPLLVGSGATAETIGQLIPYCTGVIVSSDLRKGGQAGADLDPERLKRWMSAARKGWKKANSN